MIRAKLVKVGDGQKSTTVRLKKLPLTVGRGREADLTLVHPLISRIHCEFYEVEGTLCIRDKGSMNGTYIGDIRVTEAALESGDLLTLGGTTFEVVVGGDEDVIEPPDEAESTDDDLIDLQTADEKKEKEKGKEKKKEKKKEKEKSDAAVEDESDKEAENADESDEQLAEDSEDEQPDSEGFDFLPGKKMKSKTDTDDDDDDLTDFLAGLK